jgi:hypothetical protein
MVSAAMLVYALDVTLEGREIALDGIRRGFAAYVFLFRVIDRQMFAEFLADRDVMPGFIRGQSAVLFRGSEQRGR